MIPGRKGGNKIELVNVNVSKKIREQFITENEKN
jgi:hypothetical protein